MNKKLETIRQACIKANPSIMELGFGCEIEKDGEIYKLAVETDAGLFSKTTENWWFCVSAKGQAVSLEKNVRTNILGRPIRLADVLLAISLLKNSKGYAITETGNFLVSEDIYRYNYVPCLVSWNLLKDDLRDQSEETITFLAELLK